MCIHSVYIYYIYNIDKGDEIYGKKTFTKYELEYRRRMVRISQINFYPSILSFLLNETIFQFVLLFWSVELFSNFINLIEDELKRISLKKFLSHILI